MAEGGGSEKKSGNNGGSNTEESNIAVSVPDEDGDMVVIALKVRGLKAKGSASRFFTRMSKPPTPEPLCSNATVDRWQLTSTSFSLKLTVRTAKKINAKSETAAGVGTETFQLHIPKLPSEIDSEMSKFDVEQPPHRDYSFIMVKLKKKDSSISWQQFERDNGTLDAS